MLYLSTVVRELLPPWNLCFSGSKPETQRVWTFWCSKLCTNCWHAQCPITISAAISLTLILSDEPIDLTLVSVEAVCRYHYRADQQCLCPSLKCFTHCLTLLAPMQALSYPWWSCAWTSGVWTSFLTRSFVTQVAKNDVSLPDIFSHSNMTMCWR